MKKLIAMLLALVMVLSLAACGAAPAAPAEPAPAAPAEPAPAPAEPAPAEPAGPIEIVWWTYFGDSNIGYLQTVVDAFNAEQSKYHLTIEFQGGQAEVNAKLSSTVQSELPALFNCAVENVAMCDAAPYCANLQPYVDADTAGWPELDKTWASLRAAYSDANGKLVGYPCGYSYPGLYYNADLLKEAGIDPATLLTYTDIYEASKKLVDGGYCTYGVGFHPDGYYPTASIGREGLIAYDNRNGYDGKITECLYVKDETVNSALTEMLTAYQKLHAENLCVPYGSDYQADIIPQIAAGECAMMVGVVSMTTKILNAVDGKYEIGIVPLASCTDAGKRTGEPAGGTGIFIGDNGDAAQMQGAYEFIKFLSKGEWSAHFAVSTGYLAPNQFAYDSETYQNFVKNTWPNAADIYVSLNASDDSASNPYIPISNEMKAANKLMIETVSSDPNANIADVIQTACDSIQEAIDLYNLSNP